MIESEHGEERENEHRRTEHDQVAPRIPGVLRCVELLLQNMKNILIYAHFIEIQHSSYRLANFSFFKSNSFFWFSDRDFSLPFSTHIHMQIVFDTKLE